MSGLRGQHLGEALSADVFNLRYRNKTAYDCMSSKLREHFQLDLETKTIGFLTGQLTKPAIKNK